MSKSFKTLLSKYTKLVAANTLLESTNNDLLEEITDLEEQVNKLNNDWVDLHAQLQRANERHKSLELALQAVAKKNVALPPAPKEDASSLKKDATEVKADLPQRVGYPEPLDHYVLPESAHLVIESFQKVQEARAKGEELPQVPKVAFPTTSDSP